MSTRKVKSEEAGEDVQWRWKDGSSGLTQAGGVQWRSGGWAAGKDPGDDPTTRWGWEVEVDMTSDVRFGTGSSGTGWWKVCQRRSPGLAGGKPDPGWGKAAAGGPGSQWGDVRAAATWRPGGEVRVVTSRSGTGPEAAEDKHVRCLFRSSQATTRCLT